MSAEIVSAPVMPAHGTITALEPIQPHAIIPGEIMGKGQQLAEACKKIVLATSLMLPGEGGKEKRYIRAEGWMALAAGMGLSPRISKIEVVDDKGSTSAICQLIRVYDGEVVAEAEGFVGSDELMWFGGSVTKQGRNGPYTKTYQKRPMFAVRAMAQTRAVSRACRTALAWVVPLMNQAGLVATPAEEMEVDHDQYNDYSREYHPAPPAPTSPASPPRQPATQQQPQQPATPPQSPPVAPATPSPDGITKGQQETIGALLKEVGVSPELLAEVKRRWGPSAQMRYKQAEDAIAYLTSLSRIAACVTELGGMTPGMEEALEKKFGITSFIQIDDHTGKAIIAYLEDLIG